MRSSIFPLFRGLLCATLCAMASQIIASAAVRLPGLVSDKMVLQRNIQLPIWGWADPGEWVTVRFRGQYFETQTKSDGKWELTLPAQTPGGPFVMEINDIVLRDVLVGDVWLFGGQSNQETPVNRLTERFPEIEVSNNHMIRYFKVPYQETPEKRQSDINPGGKWYSAVSSEVMNWAALEFFMAYEIYNHTHLPVGIIASAKGGTDIELWIDQDYLKEFPHLLVDQEAVSSLQEMSTDKGSGKWMMPDFDDSSWKTTQLPAYWREYGFNKVHGAIWYRKEINVSEAAAGRHAKLFMGRMQDCDSVWVNGTFVGTTAYFGPPRKYNVPTGVLKAGRNVITLKLTAMGGDGEIVKDKPYKLQCDAETISLEGDWKYNIGFNMNADKELIKRADTKRKGSGLYNGMIYPIRKYQVCGAVWYQGENNAGRANQYATLLTNLINNWRTVLDKPNLPFLLVQLPNYMELTDKPVDSDWARLREAQFTVGQTVANTAMATTYDVGEWNDIHPLDKKSIAQRLILGARKLVYGEPKLQASGPRYKDMKVEGNKIIISFTECGKGLKSRNNEPLKYFAIAGADKKFVWAKAVIKGNTVVVSADEIKEPVAVRYAWANNPVEANLMNKDGLLASPFRTDNWEK